MNNRVHTPIVYQSEAAECGAAALCAVLAYYGKNVSTEVMRQETEVSRDGCSAGAIMRAAKRNSLDCRGFRKEPEELKTIKTPCILHWEFNHFVVFEGIKGNHAYINDPAVGYRRITFSELDRSFTGVVLTFSPKPEFKKARQTNHIFKLFGKQVKLNLRVIIRLLTVGLMAVVPAVMIPLLSQVFIDNIFLEKNTELFSGLICFLAGSVTLYIVLNIYRSYLLAAFRKKLMILSARELILKIFSLPLSFFEHRYAGEIAEKVNSNSRAEAFVSDEFADALLNVLQAVANFTVMVIYCPELTVAALLCVFLSVLVTAVSSGRTGSLAFEYRARFGRFFGALCAGIRISSTIKSCGAENGYTGGLIGFNARVFESERKLGGLQYIFDSLTDALSLLSDVLILIMGGLYVINGRLTIGSLVAFSAVFGAFVAPIKSLVGLSKRVRIASAELKRAQDIGNLADANGKTNNAAPISRKLSGKIEVSHLSFKYSGSENSVLSDICFKAECGEFIAVVGASGSGKTTLLKLLSGLYSPTEGSVTYDGLNVESIADFACAGISVVGQNTEIFSGTVRDNITLWDNSVTENEIIRAAKDACIHDLIMRKPNGYDYTLAENGSDISGGERQRLEIARALVSDPTVLILDEATASLDPITEKRILYNIRRRGCTVVLAAHRLSAIRDCDTIIVLKDGRIAEAGTHPELMRAKDYYKQLVD